MSSNTIKIQREALEADARRLRERIKDCEARIRADRKAIQAIRDKLQRLAIIEAQGVRVRYRGMYQDARLDDAQGVVIAVRRTKAVIDWGPLGRCLMPIDDLLPIDSSEGQGCFIAIGGNGGAQ